MYRGIRMQGVVIATKNPSRRREPSVLRKEQDMPEMVVPMDDGVEGQKPGLMPPLNHRSGPEGLHQGRRETVRARYRGHCGSPGSPCPAQSGEAAGGKQARDEVRRKRESVPARLGHGSCGPASERERVVSHVFDSLPLVPLALLPLVPRPSSLHLGTWVPGTWSHCRHSSQRQTLLPYSHSVRYRPQPETRVRCRSQARML